MKIRIDVTKEKGRGVYANVRIPRQRVVCYYEGYVEKVNKDGIQDFTYGVTLYDVRGRALTSIFSQAKLSCITSKLFRGLPLYGPLINEPSQGQDVNTQICHTKLHQSKYKLGEQVMYKIVTLRVIEPDEELLMEYGDTYNRSHYKRSE